MVMRYDVVFFFPSGMFVPSTMYFSSSSCPRCGREGNDLRRPGQGSSRSDTMCLGGNRFEAAARTSDPWFHTRIWFFPAGGVVLEKKTESICSAADPPWQSASPPALAGSLSMMCRWLEAAARASDGGFLASHMKLNTLSIIICLGLLPVKQLLVDVNLCSFLWPVRDRANHGAPPPVIPESENKNPIRCQYASAPGRMPLPQAFMFCYCHPSTGK